ncbi:hypothetical protein J7M00_04075 [bacterium]|nr:hypothetical protein [bacterium]
MKKVILFLISFIFLVFADNEITGTVIEGGSPHFAALSPKMCGENRNDICMFFCGTPWSFTITADDACPFSPDSDYYVSTSVPTISGSEAYQAPGDPVALVGPFHVDAYGNADLGSFHEITSGGFEGTIYNADAKMIPIDSIKILIEHHYLGQDISSGEDINYYGSPTVVSPQHITSIGGGNYTYDVTDFPSGGKRVTFFNDANGNDALDAGELATTIDRDVGIVGEQYDDSIDVDLATLKVAQKSVIPINATMTAAPNPFNSTVRINISNFSPDDHILIKDITGRTIKILPAEREIIWDATDQNGNYVSTGIYFVFLEKDRSVRVRICLVR